MHLPQQSLCGVRSAHAGINTLLRSAHANPLPHSVPVCAPTCCLHAEGCQPPAVGQQQRVTMAVHLLQQIARRAKAYMAKHIMDPGLREALTPQYQPGCKRICLSSAYYPALAQPNVQVVAAGLDRVSQAQGRVRRNEGLVGRGEAGGLTAGPLGACMSTRGGNRGHAPVFCRALAAPYKVTGPGLVVHTVLCLILPPPMVSVRQRMCMTDHVAYHSVTHTPALLLCYKVALHIYVGL
jgi:hypothetical protein